MSEGPHAEPRPEVAASAVSEARPHVRVLVVEDDAHAAQEVAREIAALGWGSAIVDRVSAARALLAARPVDIVYLDRMLADGEDGIALLQWLHGLEDDMPCVLVASRLSTTDDHVRGLDAGADDYIDKPFAPQELRARLRALARRRGQRRVPASVHVWDALEVRTVNRVALWQGQAFELRAQSFDMLCALVELRGEWASRDALWRRLWPNQAHMEPRRYLLNVATSRLRAGLADAGCRWHVESADGLGYRLVPRP